MSLHTYWCCKRLITAAHICSPSTGRMGTSSLCSIQCIKSTTWAPGSARAPISDSNVMIDGSLFVTLWTPHAWIWTHGSCSLCQRKLKRLIFVSKCILQSTNHNYKFKSSTFLIQIKGRYPFPWSNFLFRKWWLLSTYNRHTNYKGSILSQFAGRDSVCETNFQVLFSVAFFLHCLEIVVIKLQKSLLKGSLIIVIT